MCLFFFFLIFSLARNVSSLSPSHLLTVSMRLGPKSGHVTICLFSSSFQISLTGYPLRMGHRNAELLFLGRFSSGVSVPLFEDPLLNKGVYLPAKNQGLLKINP